MQNTSTQYGCWALQGPVNRKECWVPRSEGLGVSDDIKNLTPLFQQYYGLKQAYPDCLVLMQCGDFYEAYGEDAETFSRDLSIALTAKEAGGGRKLAMAGVPLHSLDGYLRGLVKKGHRVAIAEQTADPSTCKGIVPREVSRIVTAGTIVDDQLLDEKSHNYLLCLAPGKSGRVGVAAADISTGAFVASEIEAEAERISEELACYQPSEIILAGDGNQRIWLSQAVQSANAAIVDSTSKITVDEATEFIKQEFKLGSLGGLDLQDKPQAVVAAAILVRYLLSTAFMHGVSLGSPHGYTVADCMILDACTRRNLELTETLMGRERKGSLLDCLDSTCTSMGARCLREWLLRPLISLSAIQERHQMVQALVDEYEVTGSLRAHFSRILDIERLTARAVFGTANARDLLAIEQSLRLLPAIIDTASRLPEVAKLQSLLINLDPHCQLQQQIAGAISSEPPATLHDGGLIADGFDANLDKLRQLRGQSKGWIAALEERERRNTGIKGLKVGYTSVFGYYLEVTKANQSLVPAHYVRKQTLVNAERYIIPELKEYESKVLGAEEQIKKLEYELFTQIRNSVAAQADSLRRAAVSVSELDAFCSLAEVAIKRRWVCPELSEDNVVDLRDCRHPVVEAARKGDFVPNNCYLDGDKRVIILTGPNMSGKSTWLRQVAQAVILCQMGAFVPAQRARLGIMNRVFTRVGASDDLHLGQSTFMVEMSETANIVNNATPRSLVILDEIGRGTSTFDGLAIARAVLEHLHDVSKCLTLFATHFHELTSLERSLSGCRNFRVAVREMPDEVIFLHKIVPGGADRSYGVYVARLAGMPECVLQRANYLLKRLESRSKRQAVEKDSEVVQLGLF